MVTTYFSYYNEQLTTVVADVLTSIEPWLAEHGHLSDWHKEWDTLTHPRRPIALPLTLDEPPVGSIGALGVNHLPLAPDSSSPHCPPPI